jgi:hypothetical protein
MQQKEEKDFVRSLLRRAKSFELRVNKLLQIREDSYGTQNLSYEIGIRDRGADESA